MKLTSKAGNILYASYGETLALKGKWGEAQKWIDKANKIAPTDSRVLLTTGIYYYWKREYETANEYFSKISPERARNTGTQFSFAVSSGGSVSSLLLLSLLRAITGTHYIFKSSAHPITNK